MLDFAKSGRPTLQARCQSRARVARKSARLLCVVLAGLVGGALALEPAIISEVLAPAYLDFAGLMEDAAKDTSAVRTITPAIPVVSAPLDTLADTRGVSRATTNLLDLSGY